MCIEADMICHREIMFYQEAVVLFDAAFDQINA